MKRTLSVLLMLILCFSLLACNAKEQEPPILLPGTWMVKSPQLEATYTFKENKKGISGSYEYYNYSDNNWGEFTFTVKEQTDSIITLLIDDGTLDVMPYAVIGNHLYLDGILYTNASEDVPTFSELTAYSLLMDGKNYPVYGEVFLGMHVDDVRDSIGQQFELESNHSSDYQYASRCPYSADLQIQGDYYQLSMGFDSNRRLVHLTTQGHYSKEVIENLVFQLNQDFGETFHSIYREKTKNFKWFTGSYEIELQIHVSYETSEIESFTLSYFYMQ